MTKTNQNHRPANSAHFDAIVVGSGPGGGTVARELTRSGQKVLILEWGSRDRVDGSNQQTLRELFVPGKSFLLTPELIGVGRGITTGGSSIYFAGTAFQPPFEMFERHGVDLRGAIAEARAELPIAPLAPRLIGPKSSRIMDAAVGLGHAWSPLEKFIYQDRCRSFVPMGFYGAPSYEAKWNARMWVDEAVARGAVLETGARVREVIVERGRATGVVYTRGRRTFRAHAGRVVLAAGGIGSPTILRASGLEGTGRDFFVDPLVFAVGQVEGPGGPAELPMSTGLHLHADGVMMTDYAMPRLMHNLNALQVGALGNMRAQPYAHSLVIMVKVKDELGGRLTSRGGVRRRLSAADHAKLDHGYRLARAILERAGAREVYKTRVIAAHPGGTVKLGELVDENLETSIANLHVCDCSVVPEAWGLPPTLALIGLGKYLARRVTASDRTHPGTQPRANIE